VNAALRTRGPGRRYGQRWALRDRAIDLPAGHVVGPLGLAERPEPLIPEDLVPASMEKTGTDRRGVLEVRG